MSVPTVQEYRLELGVALVSGEFHGTVEIDLDGIDGPFPLNAVGLDIDAARWGDRAARIEPRPDEEELWIQDPPRGAGTLEVRFHGRASSQGLIGLYRCRYGSAEILTTQCQPTGTRRLFPCIDRPDRKATFRLTLTTEADADVIFNTPAKSEQRDGGRVTRIFAPTPPMATYLFYVGIGKFDWLRDTTGRVALAVAAPPGRAASGRFALDHARALLAAYETYFGIPYPLPKLDLVTVPEHAWGAMENWGAIAFRDVRLLVDAGSSGRQRRDTLSTIAHEIAHQWFGNLVTMEWWTDIWLNESFATLMELLMVERIAPGSGMLDDFLLLWTSPGKFGDSLSSTRPVVATVRRPDEIGQAFDEISYGKGASVLRMIEGFLGEETFRAGVSAYLNRFRFGNARSEDLWSALEHASGLPVGEILGAWLKSPGLPLLRARAAEGGVEVDQARFSLLGPSMPGLWPIPLTYTVGGQRRTTLFRDRSIRLPADGPILLNPDARGVYRVRYDGPLTDALLERFGRLGPVDRWTILEDLAAFVLSGESTPAEYLRFVEAQRRAREYLVVQELVGDLGWFASILGTMGELSAPAIQYLRDQWDLLGDRPLPNESEADGILRARVANTLLFLDRKFASSLATRFDGVEKLDANLRGPILAAYARVGGREAQERLTRALRAESREALQFDYEYALVSSEDPSLVGEALALVRTELTNRAHTAQILRRSAVNPEGRAPAWQWIRTELPRYAADYPGTDLGGYVLQHALPFTGLGRMKEVREFLRDHPIPLASRGAEKGLALLEATDRFYRRFR